MTSSNRLAASLEGFARRASGALLHALLGLTIVHLALPLEALALERAQPGARDSRALDMPDAQKIDPAALPDFFSVSVDEAGPIHFLRTEGGFVFEKEGDASRSGFLSNELIETQRFHLEATDHGFEAEVLVPGRQHAVRIAGEHEHIHEIGDLLRGRIFDPSYAGPDPTFELRIPPSKDRLHREAGGSTDSLRSIGDEHIIIIVVVPAVLVLTGCWIVAAVTNCITDCATACADYSGVQSAEEGFCGTCSCTCFENSSDHNHDDGRDAFNQG